MPAGRFYKYKSKVRKPKSLKKKVTSLARKVALNEPETKELYTLRQFAVSVANDEFTSLTTCQQGNANGTRIGDKIRLKSVTINILVKLANPNELVGTDSTQGLWSLTGGNEYMRVMLICNKQTNNSATNFIGEILENAGSQINKQFSVYDLDTVGWKKKYAVLYDKLIQVSNMSGSPYANIKIFKKLSYIINYNSDNGDETDIIDKNIQLLIINDASDIDYGFSARVRYSDA